MDIALISDKNISTVFLSLFFFSEEVIGTATIPENNDCVAINSSFDALNGQSLAAFRPTHETIGPFLVQTLLVYFYFISCFIPNELYSSYF